MTLGLNIWGKIVKMIKNIKIVFIGRSSSGKTTLLNEFGRRGCKCLHETAREVLKERKQILVRGKYENPDLQEHFIRQKLMYEKQLENEKKSSGLVFHDRSLVDVLAYTNYFGVDDSFIDKNLLRGRYDLVFNLEQREFIVDEERIESGAEEAQRIHDCVLETYKNLGYSLIIVPNFREDRLDNAMQRAWFVKNSICERR
jgi:predicted ATPase